jgi:hypothetical protein
MRKLPLPARIALWVLALLILYILIWQVHC